MAGTKDDAFKAKELRNKLERLEIRAVKNKEAYAKIEKQWQETAAKLKDHGVVVNYKFAEVFK